MTAIVIVVGLTLLVAAPLWLVNREAERGFVDRIADLKKQLDDSKVERDRLINDVKERFEGEIRALTNRVRDLEAQLRQRLGGAS